MCGHIFLLSKYIRIGVFEISGWYGRYMFNFLIKCQTLFQKTMLFWFHMYSNVWDFTCMEKYWSGMTDQFCHFDFYRILHKYNDQYVIFHVFFLIFFFYIVCYFSFSLKEKFCRIFFKYQWNHSLLDKMLWGPLWH